MKRAVLSKRLSDALRTYEDAHGTPPGISLQANRTAFVGQLVASVRRTIYVDILRSRISDPDVASPSSAAFNPLSAAAWHLREGNADEAYWLVFLAAHFGKHRRSGWRLIADVYGQMGNETSWSWKEVSGDVDGFRIWLDGHEAAIRSLQPTRGFGNHRKYESLGAWNDSGTGAVVESYVRWTGVGGPASRTTQITEAGATANERFDLLYKSVREVRQFGRTGAFDYCATLHKLRVADIEPGAAYFSGSTGPLKGARLFFGGQGDAGDAAALEAKLKPMQANLDVGFDVLEDALCNWQKTPGKFTPFLG